MWKRRIASGDCAHTLGQPRFHLVGMGILEVLFCCSGRTALGWDFL